MTTPPTPQVARIPRPPRAVRDENPRLGGAVYRREVVLPVTPTPSRGAYFRMEAPSRSAYSPPAPRCKG